MKNSKLVMTRWAALILPSIRTGYKSTFPFSVNGVCVRAIRGELMNQVDAANLPAND